LIPLAPNKRKEVLGMTFEELKAKWYEWYTAYEDHLAYKEMVESFCKTYATNLWEWDYIYALLMDGHDEEAG
jgi:hypothetical protein